MGFLSRLFQKAHQLNGQNILDLASLQKSANFLDLGCDDGVWTMKVAKSCEAQLVHGIEIVESRAEKARAKGVQVQVADLSEPYPFDDNMFDCIHSNQVIEHVPNVDLMATEIFRVLKPGGTAIISTENGSSWHNVFAAIMGWQTFSLTNMSAVAAGIGNPLALLRGQSIEFSSWTHKVIFNYLGLIEFFQTHGFEFLEIKGAGYYPFPGSFGRIDPRHAHFLTIHVRKPTA